MNAVVQGCEKSLNWCC